MTDLLSSKWNTETQTPHGGQEWRDLPNFIQDFSVTTNALGTPKKALEAAKDAVQNTDHYPPSDFEPALSGLASFLAEGGAEDVGCFRDRLVLGNGASELIDLCVRLCESSTWQPGPEIAQYMEYARAAQNSGKWIATSDAGLICIVNPCNPTGGFMCLQEIKDYIMKNSRNKGGTTVIVDESMIPWQGPQWRSGASLVSQSEWIEHLVKERQPPIKVYIIHSWTKIWSCPGLRIGSVLAPTKAAADHLKKHQVPWSLNCAAVAFLAEVVKDSEYLEETWKLTSEWRRYTTDSLSKIHPEWQCHGAPFLSWIWIDVKEEQIAEKCVRSCRHHGVPIRWGRFGYQCPTFIRVAVRHPKYVDVLIGALSATSLERF